MIAGHVVFLELPECTFVTLVTKDEEHEWVKLYRDKMAAVDDAAWQGIITAAEADALKLESHPPATWHRAIDLHPKVLGRCGWTFFPGKVGLYH